MTVNAKSLGIDRLDVEARIALVEEIWDSIAADGGNFPLTETQTVELERRATKDETRPEEVVSWEKVKASARSRFGK